MINVIKEREYPIPQCMLVGYGREQIRRFVCQNCGEEFFMGDDKTTVDYLICEDCIDLDKDVVVESDNEPYIKIVGWRQEVSTFKKRSIYNYVKVAKRDNHTCQYCGYSPRLFVKFLPMHVDHIKPFSAGGNNSMKNLVLSCSECNLHLSNKLFRDFHEKKTHIIEWRKENGKPFTEKRWKDFALMTEDG